MIAPHRLLNPLGLPGNGLPPAIRSAVESYSLYVHMLAIPVDGLDGVYSVSHQSVARRFFKDVLLSGGTETHFDWMLLRDVCDLSDRVIWDEVISELADDVDEDLRILLAEETR